MQVLPSRIVENVLERDRDYWREKLSGEPAPSGLPADGRRAAGLVATRGELVIQVRDDLAERVWRTGGGHAALTFTLMVAAFKLCLFKYTSVTDLLLGSAAHDREPDVAQLNAVLPLRTTLDPSAPLLQFLEAVRQTVTEAFTHQKFPFESLVELLRPGAAEPSAFFDIALVMEGVNRRSLPDQAGVAIVVEILGTQPSLSIRCLYDAQLFRRGTVERFVRDIQTCLRVLVEQPDVSPMTIDLLTEDERAWLLRTPSAAAGAESLDTVTALVHARASTDPDAVAVTSGVMHVTFAGMAAAAKALAAQLRSAGVRTGSRVGVYVDHSERLPIALLGVLEAGGAYVPIDPRHPSERIRHVLADANVSVIVTESATAACLPDFAGTLIFVPWVSRPRFRHASVPIAGPADLAYVMYTSGSTGAPKGVCVPHRALASYIRWASAEYLDGDRVNFALCSSLAFDLTVTSIFVPMAAGGCIHVFRSDSGGWPMAAILQHGAVDALKLTPSHLAMLTDDDHQRSSVRLLIVGGENLETDAALAAVSRLGRIAKLFNEYGPTEATVGCMIHRFQPDADLRGSVPIGVAAPGCQVLVLDKSGQLAPINGIGELCVAGVQLATGYLDNPTLTASSFVEHPFAPGTVMYRTGDRARPLPEGVLEFRGRTDGQLKFHGHRVEVDEIRTALNAHPRVRDSVIRICDDEQGDQVMVAYYVSRQALDPAELREHLSRRVITETLPQLFCHLTRLPLTLNGKLDLCALPSLRDVRKALQPALAPPRNDVERRLAALWADVLGLEQVGIHDNFFELGGHSLLAMRILSRIRQDLGAEIAVSRLFERPTIAELARDLASSTTNAAPSVLPVVRGAALPVSFAQERLWFAHQLDRESAAYNVPLTSIVEGATNVAAIELAYGEIIRRHETLRSAFPSVDGRPVCRIHAPRLRGLPLVDLRALPADEAVGLARRLSRADTVRPFDLQEGPVQRARLLLGPAQLVRVLTVSHLVADAWSAGIVAAEWDTLTAAYATGVPSPLPELTIQYVDYAAWQRRRMTDAAIDELLGYWSAQLRDMPPVLELTGQRPRPAVQRFRGAQRSIRLPIPLSAAIRSLSVAAQATPFMTLLACFFVLVHLRSRQVDFGIGTDVAGRSPVDVEPLVGLFVNQLVLRADLTRNPDLRTLIDRARRTCLNAYAHQDLPFDRLVRGLRVKRDLSRNPLFQVMFSFQNTPLPTRPSSADLAKPVHVEKHTAVFDVSLSMMDAGDHFIVWLRYNADLFDADWASMFLDDFVWIAGAAMEQPEATLAALVGRFEEHDRARRAARLPGVRDAARQRLASIHRRARA